MIAIALCDERRATSKRRSGRGAGAVAAPKKRALRMENPVHAFYGLKGCVRFQNYVPVFISLSN